MMVEGHAPRRSHEHHGVAFVFQPVADHVLGPAAQQPSLSLRLAQLCSSSGTTLPPRPWDLIEGARTTARAYRPIILAALTLG